MVPIELLPEPELILKLILAVILGGLIGLDRELKGRPAGLRTHVLVCVGATLFTIISMSFMATSDPARIAAGIVTGIGFLGAGAIFRSDDHIKGLTTAADLWVIAAV
ncbi:MAG: MgtC/SapB family protein, partial [Candidatus Diapherotrites archaeon]